MEGRKLHSPQPHKETRIALKWAKVDKTIQPVIKWLNSFDSIFTRWSCEGTEDSDDPYYPPYIIFYCDDGLGADIQEVLLTLDGYAKTTIEAYNGMMRYRIEFTDKSYLRGLIDDLNYILS